MDILEIQSYCLNKKGVTEETPFGPDNLVYKVMGKMFVLVSLDAVPLRMNLKNTPAKNEELRETYPFVLPGYHQNKAHWNTVIIEGFIQSKLIKSLIDESYQLVVNGLPKKLKAELASIEV